ncbi:hypothetical protein DVJ77_18630 [Dyella tabacisoli]|uniref:DUF2384 domain-containing protein n=1 Tax=Dyella tabacisoli TaxID=2282381 RepID=A0A369UKP0_9GAMM|nr:hypothetical protein DVJ77_18630 [Dyella tabacisoli]
MKIHPPLNCVVPPPATIGTIWELARKIEPDAFAAMHWYRHVPITELGNLSARQLVAQGQAESVVTFLESIYFGDRG